MKAGGWLLLNNVKTVEWGWIAAYGKDRCLGKEKTDRYAVEVSKSKPTKKQPFPFLSHELTLWVVRPIARRLMLHHRIGIEQGKQQAQELQQIKDTLEIIRRQLDHLSHRGAVGR